MSLLSEIRSMGFFDDPLKIALTIGGIAIFIGLLCIGTVVWANKSSSILALAFLAVVGATSTLTAKMYFDLSEKSNTDSLMVELMIDRAKPEIRQHIYLSAGNGYSGRIGHEVGASNYLVKNDRSQFDGNGEHREQLNGDMVLFSLMSFFGTEQYDWRYKTTNLRGQTMGTIHAEQVTDNNECTLITPQQIQEKLTAAGNVFANAPIHVMGKRLCLPPNSSLTISREKLEITTPFCTISFEPLSSGSVSYAKPGSGEIQAPVMANGEPRFETRPTKIRTKVTFSWIRAKHQEMKQYEDWSNRVVNGARIWFEASEPKTGEQRQ